MYLKLVRADIWSAESARESRDVRSVFYHVEAELGSVSSLIFRVRIRPSLPTRKWFEKFKNSLFEEKKNQEKIQEKKQTEGTEKSKRRFNKRSI
jgi:hypothetical protein